MSCLGKSHADAALRGTDCSHCESINLASLRSRKAFFSDRDSTPRAPSQGPVRKKKRGRGFEQLVTSELTPAQCPRTSPSPKREHSPVLFTQHDQRPCGCERHDLVRCEWQQIGRQPFSGSFRRGKDYRALWLTPPSCHLLLHATPESEWMKSSSASWWRLSTSSGSNGLCLRSHLAAGWTSGFLWGAIKPSAIVRPPSSPKFMTSSRNCGTPPTHLAPVLLLPLLYWHRWRERIRAPASSGWVCGHTSLSTHGYRMGGEGEPSVQAVQSYICTRWTCLLGGWTSGFSASLYDCALGLPGQDARQWGSQSGCSFTQGPEERDRPGSTCHQSHRPGHRVFDVLPDSVRAPPLAQGDEE